MLKAQNTDRTYRTRFGAAFGETTSSIKVFMKNHDYGIGAALMFGFPFVVVECYRDVHRNDSGRYVGRIDPEMAEILKKDAL
ncbi:MAG TPA: hypothetical protein VJB05_02360 [archaeon]|nr:hypothetical protein [archaeon]